MNDFRALHLNIAMLTTNPVHGEQFSEGNAIMNQCFAEAQSLLNLPYNIVPPSSSTDQAVLKEHLQRVIVDASARRFQAHKIYLKMAAASRWVFHQVEAFKAPKTKSQFANALHAAREALHSVRFSPVSRSPILTRAQPRTDGDYLHQELTGITDNFVINDLLSADIRAGYWLGDDPPLSTILSWIC
ncbi:hypothetical protein EMCG_02969 [[Emmonsia] crescens]|uniref:Uncharacterized protein n=1 Tax=[Emmonsia] crescens TaxID=73230 RepID=A0A0G2HWE2_9EURO|nr:hypothetical protein EMCG_02969 [Emmonsia crescens UAMH 3008]